MLRRHQADHKDLFWFGILVGAVIGGIAGFILGTEVGSSARHRLEIAAKRVRSRFNGSTSQSENSGEEESIENPN